MKKCSNCMQEKKLSDYHTYKAHNGKHYPRSACRDCKNEMDYQNRLKNKSKNGYTIVNCNICNMLMSKQLHRSYCLKCARKGYAR